MINKGLDVSFISEISDLTEKEINGSNLVGINDSIP